MDRADRRADWDTTPRDRSDEQSESDEGTEYSPPPGGWLMGGPHSATIALQNNTGELEPPDLYDPHVERQEYLDTAGPWSDREYRVLRERWPDRDYSFEPKSSEVHGKKGRRRTLMQLECKYRDLTGEKFALYEYLEYYQAELNGQTVAQETWISREEAILRYTCAEPMDWGKRVQLYLNKTGKKAFQSQLRSEAIGLGYARP